MELQLWEDWPIWIGNCVMKIKWERNSRATKESFEIAFALFSLFTRKLPQCLLFLATALPIFIMTHQNSIARPFKKTCETLFTSRCQLIAGIFRILHLTFLLIGETNDNQYGSLGKEVQLVRSSKDNGRVVMESTTQSKTIRFRELFFFT